MVLPIFYNTSIVNNNYIESEVTTMTNEERELIQQAISDIYELAEKVRTEAISKDEVYSELIALVHENLGTLV
jgi:hypothetical protein